MSNDSPLDEKYVHKINPRIIHNNTSNSNNSMHLDQLETILRSMKSIGHTKDQHLRSLCNQNNWTQILSYFEKYSSKISF